MRGATQTQRIYGLDVHISIHAPLAGCDKNRHKRRPSMTHFNPRTPCGVRHGVDAMAARGSDFNPRTPCGVRPSPRTQRTRRRTFQSTHPLRGATITIRRSRRPSKISIHAPLAGCDQIVRGVCSATTHFNPRTPCGVRPHPGSSGRKKRSFQSTHPLRGATRRRSRRTIAARISIHAPLAGCDGTQSKYRQHSNNFNPRTPCGVRHANHRKYHSNGHISIHAPLAGCDKNRIKRTRAPRHFNPRTPCGVRLPKFIPIRSYVYFNPRTPCGVRLSNAVLVGTAPVISIHAPLAGCDLITKIQ